MAKPIELGLILEGQDAVDFEKYCQNPTFTLKSLNAMREALKRIDENGTIDE